MTWIVLAALSAIFLGIYEAAKKAAVRDNAVLAVLFTSVAIGGSLWLPFILWSTFAADSIPAELLRVSPLDGRGHLLLFLKSFIVGCSWAMAYFALKDLPVSIAGPIRSIGPVWTILIATTMMGERPRIGQWVGIAIILFAFYAFSRVGHSEGIVFHNNRGVSLMMLATFIGACSGLYDKFLLQSAGFDASTVQAWFSFYLVVVLFPLYLYWRTCDRVRSPFEWRWSIPLITTMLLAADFLYFTAIAQPDALIAVISPVRRVSVFVSFLIGIFVYGERNFRPKAICLVVLLMGVFLLGLM